MTTLSKLQIRAKVLSVIAEIKTIKKYNQENLALFTENLKEIDDRQTLFDVFIKEYIKMEEVEYTFSACLLKNLVPIDYINDKALENLKSPTLSDNAKYKLVQLLRIAGGNCNYSDLPSYFENPEEVLDMETKKLLENAIFNPEAMLDFLDFISAVSRKDRSLLLNSLKQDYRGDELANIVYPILYSNFEDDFILEAIELLGESKSSLALKPFEYLIETNNNENIVNTCKTGLKKLKLAGATIEKAEAYFKNIIKDSKPAEFYTTIPDGNGNQALLTSRINKTGQYSLAAIVINDTLGIVDCFGFYNISENEIVKVIEKFYKSEGKYKVESSYVKTRINQSVQLTIKKKRTFPYEFICWSPLICDIEPLNLSVEEDVKLNSNIQEITKDELLDLLTKDYTLRWFITPNENKGIKELTDYIYNQDKLDIEELNKKIKNEINDIFDENNKKIWHYRIINLIYLLKTKQLKKEANIFYTMLNTEDLYKTFKNVLVQRSIFSYFISIKENQKDSIFSSNIFKKRNTNEPTYDIKKINNIIEKLKRSWING